MQTDYVHLSITLNSEQAWEFAQFLKRIGFSEYRRQATSDEQAHCMMTAGEIVRRALAEHGYAPR